MADFTFNLLAKSVNNLAVQGATDAIQREDCRGEIHRWDYVNLPGPRMRYFYYDPEEVSENITPNYETIDILGRSSPIFSYKGTSEREIVITITLFARSKDTLYNDVRGFCDWLKCFVYPIYVNGNMLPPSRIFLSLGRFINILGILNAYHPRFKGPYDLTKVSSINRDGSASKIAAYYPMICEIPLEIKEIAPYPLDAIDMLVNNRDQLSGYENERYVDYGR